MENDESAKFRITYNNHGKVLKDINHVVANRGEVKLELGEVLLIGLNLNLDRSLIRMLYGVFSASPL